MAENTKSRVSNALKNNSNVPAKKTGKRQGLAAVVERMLPEISMAVKKVMDPDRFARMTFSAIRLNPKLEACDQGSFCAAMMQAAQLGLEPNTSLGQAYLIPYGNQCQFQIGYKGLIELAYRSGKIVKIDAQTVYENDEFEYELGWDSKLKHIPAMSNRGDPIGFYAVFKLKDGGGNFLFMSKEDIDKHRDKFSQAFKSKRPSGPWVTDYEAMAKKTCLKMLLKYAPISVELGEAVASDESFKQIDINNYDGYDVLAQQPEFEVDGMKVDSETGEVIGAEIDPQVKKLMEEMEQEEFNLGK